MRPVKMHEAKTHFSRLIGRVEAGEEVIVQRGDTPVARIVPYRSDDGPRTPGALRGRMRIAPGFDEVPEEFDDLVS